MQTFCQIVLLVLVLADWGWGIRKSLHGFEAQPTGWPGIFGYTVELYLMLLLLLGSGALSFLR